MNRPGRFLLVALAALFALPAATAAAANRMPIGFFDDIVVPLVRRPGPESPACGGRPAPRSSTRPRTGRRSRRPSPRTPRTATTPRTASATSTSSSYQSGLYGMRVMINITGTPKWANGNKTPNHLPKKLVDLTTFASMLATRYNGRHGHGSVALSSVWNEPNLAAVPDAAVLGQEDRRPGELRQALQGRVRRASRPATRSRRWRSARRRRAAATSRSAARAQTVAPGTFAQLLSQAKGLKFDAWAHHPYPTSPNLPPTQKVRYPNVTLSTLPQFEKDLREVVPPHGADLDHRVRPRDEAGRAARRLDRRAGDVREAGARDRDEGPERADVHLVHVPRQRRATRGRAGSRAVRRCEAGRTRRSARSRA